MNPSGSSHTNYKPPETKVLVTGASGFVASHICLQLQSLGYQVVGTVRSVRDLKKVTPLRKLCPTATYPLQLVEADLLRSKGWAEAVKGCSFVIHVASPVPATEPDDEQTVIQPAVRGTLNVLKACRDSGCVKRVVLTSSVYSIVGQSAPNYEKIYSEDDWTDMNCSVAAYAKSKTLAERAAWDFIQALPDKHKLQLAVINPSYVMGPVLHGSCGASQVVISKLMKNEISVLPQISLQICDVRDVAKAHIQAMTLAEAAGNRYIINTGVLWLRECSDILRQEFANQGYKLSVTTAPKFLVWAAARFDKSLLKWLPRWGKELRLDNTKMLTGLNIVPREKKDTVLDMAYSMVEAGFLPKAPHYRPLEIKAP